MGVDQAGATSDRVLPSMGYQPALDGLRAVSVIAVLLYHAGFSWIRGGFFGVEVFFVVSGYLITSLLLDEHARGGRIDFKQFWIRRIRRLFPALYAVLFAVVVWAVFSGTDEQVSQVRHDVPWAVFYAGNWGQVLGDVPYFSGEPPLLRHLWSLAVEEQWYLVWPLVFAGIVGVVSSRKVAGALVLAAAVAVMLFTFWLHAATPTRIAGPGVFDNVDRTNFLYLSTITRAGGLLLGAGAAFLWQPWQHVDDRQIQRATVGRVLDPVGAAAVTGLGCIVSVAVLTEGYVYQWLLPLVSVLSLIAVMVSVHPGARGFRRIMSTRLLVEIGKRSYGLYLWSWPIFVMVGATDGAVGRFGIAMLVSIVVAELSYRLIETPVRRGILTRWWHDRAPITYAPIAGVTFLFASLVWFYADVDEFSRFEGGDEVAFDLTILDEPANPGHDEAAATVGSDSQQDAASPELATIGTATTGTPISAGADSPASTTTEVPDVPVLAIVGDSQAHALAVNQPAGIEQVFTIVDGSVDGCGVLNEGKAISSVPFRNDFAVCVGWQEKWAESASEADVALVVVGAWDVFDIQTTDTYYQFGTGASDRLFARGLMSGIDAMLETGTDVALLEVACMRPVNVEGAGVNALPERGNDARIAHLNGVVRWVSAQYGPDVRVVDGPAEWCNDEEIATSLAHRWDGVHVYGPGAKLIYEEVAADLLALVEHRPDGSLAE